MPLKELTELIAKYEETRLEHDREITRLEGRLDTFENSRNEILKVVAGDNANDEARQRLDKEDARIDELKKKIAEEQDKERKKLLALKTKILQTQENVVKNLQRGIQDRHEQLQELREALIPEAEQRVADLRENERQIEKEVADLQKQSRKASALVVGDLFRE